MFSEFLFNGVLAGSLLSAVVHVGTGGGLYYWFTKRQPPPIVAELDLSMSPLLPVVPNQGGGSGAKAPETWTLPKKDQTAPIPVVPETPPTKEEVTKEEAQMAPCEGPCSAGPVIGEGWGGGTGEGDGEYVPVSETSRKPRWVKNFIRSSDYPAVARQEGKDGRVILTVLIDSEGQVRDARLLQGSYEIFNEVRPPQNKNRCVHPRL
jgi:hypothetical protein